jgi:hypothetical protein
MRKAHACGKRTRGRALSRVRERRTLAYGLVVLLIRANLRVHSHDLVRRSLPVRGVEEATTQSRHLLDDLRAEPIDVCDARELLDLIGERADDRRLRSNVDQPMVRSERILPAGLESCDREELRGHERTLSNAEASPLILDHTRREPVVPNDGGISDWEAARLPLEGEWIKGNAVAHAGRPE